MKSSLELLDILSIASFIMQLANMENSSKQGLDEKTQSILTELKTLNENVKNCQCLLKSLVERSNNG